MWVQTQFVFTIYFFDSQISGKDALMRPFQSVLVSGASASDSRINNMFFDRPKDDTY